MTRFDPTKRQRLLNLLREGRTVTEAAASVGISTTTVSKWAARGRAPEADPEAAGFARAFDGLRHDRVVPLASDDDTPLTVADARKLLERSARGGSVTAQRILLTELHREQEAREREETLRAMGIKDPFRR